VGGNKLGIPLFCFLAMWLFFAALLPKSKNYCDVGFG
jgi:hypothetical protein